MRRRASSGGCASNHGRHGAADGLWVRWGGARGRMGRRGHARTVDGRDGQEGLSGIGSRRAETGSKRPSLELLQTQRVAARHSRPFHGNRNSAATGPRTISTIRLPTFALHSPYCTEAPCFAPLPCLNIACATVGVTCGQAKWLTLSIHPTKDGAQSHLITIRRLRPSHVASPHPSLRRADSPNLASSLISKPAAQPCQAIIQHVDSARCSNRPRGSRISHSAPHRASCRRKCHRQPPAATFRAQEVVWTSRTTDGWRPATLTTDFSVL